MIMKIVSLLVALIVSALPCSAQFNGFPLRPMAPYTGNLAFPDAPSIDWNGDGLGDQFSGYTGGIAVAYWLPGGGWGPFQVLIALPSNHQGWVLDAADLDGDGNLDLFIAVNDGNSYSTFSHRIARGDGMGGVVGIDAAPFAIGIASVGYGGMWLLRLNSRPLPIIVGSLTVQWGIERFVIQYSEYDPVTRSWPPVVIGAIDPGPGLEAEWLGLLKCDFDGDGVKDWLWRILDPLYSSIYPYSLGVLRGLPQPPYIDTTFRVIPLPQPWYNRLYQFVCSDVNRDGREDAVLVRTLLSTPPIGVSAHVGFGDANSMLRFTGAQSVLESGLRGEAKFEDFDGDELIDALYVAWTSSVPPVGQAPWDLVLHRGRPDGTFSRSYLLRGGVPGVGTHPVSDIDVDGDRDMYLSSSSGVQVALNDSLMGRGVAAVGGQVPRIRRGRAELGNAEFFIAMDLAPAGAATVLAAGLVPAAGGGPIGVDLSQLLWPLGALGPQTTDFRGLAYQVIPLPNAPSLVGAEIYFQWAVASPNTMGFALTQTAKVVLWN